MTGYFLGPHCIGQILISEEHIFSLPRNKSSWPQIFHRPFFFFYHFWSFHLHLCHMIKPELRREASIPALTLFWLSRPEQDSTGKNKWWWCLQTCESFWGWYWALVLSCGVATLLFTFGSAIVGLSHAGCVLLTGVGRPRGSEGGPSSKAKPK